MPRKVLNKENLQKVISTLNGAKVSMETFASLVGISYKTVRNQKKKFQDLGVSFIRANEAEVLNEEDKLLKLRGLINVLLNKKGLPSYFEAPTPKNLSKQEALNQYTKLTKEELKATKEDVKAITTVNLQYKFPEFRPFVLEEDLALIKEIFQELFNLPPTEEQIKVVYKSYVFFTQRKYDHIPGVIQADAGSSKTTCMKALQRFMEKKGVSVPKLISKTNKALEDIEYGATYTSFISDTLDHLEPVKHGSESTGATALFSYLYHKEKVPFLIVDEFSLLSLEEINTLVNVTDKILFVGDINQLGTLKAYPGIVIATLETQYRFLNAVTPHQVTLSSLLREKRELEMKAYVESHSVGSFDCFLNYKETSDGAIKPFCDYSKSFGQFKDLLSRYKGKDSHVIAYSVDAVKNINIIMNDGEEIKVGSKVRLIKKHHKLVNGVPGTYWYVTEVKEHTCVCSSIERGLIEVPKSSLTLGFATTSWVSQGSAWDNVLAVMGTADVGSKFTDMSTIATRCKKELKMIYRSEIDVEVKDVFTFLSSSVGNRYTSSATTIKAFCRYMRDIKELEGFEIIKSVNFGIKLDGYMVEQVGEEDFKLIKLQDSKEDTPTEVETLTEPSYSYVSVYTSTKGKEVKVFPTANQRVKSEAQVDLLINKRAKQGKKSIKAVNLYGSKYIVIDTDNAEKTKKYFDLIGDKTEVWISDDKDSAHFVFTVDKLYKSKTQVLGRQTKVDLLGNNSKNQLRLLKDNKKHNGLSPIPLSEEILKVLEGDIGQIVVTELNKGAIND